MTSRRWNYFATKLLAMVASCLLGAAAVAAQTQQLTIEQLVGSYKGHAKTATRDLSLTLEIKLEGEKLSGRLLESNNEHKILAGEIKENKLVLQLTGATGAERLMLEKRDGRLVGEWVIASGEWTSTGGKPGLIQFDRVPAAADEISGEWDAAADAQGQAFPFTLNLKLDGDKVTGSSDSQLGHSTISTGVWKDGKLTLLLDSANGPVGLVANLVDGKLVGDYDYAGQLQGKWVALRKK
ncbi:MAG TPA: hypothetical protein VIF81_01550 [Pyrinomonadaceae bacterium]